MAGKSLLPAPEKGSRQALIEALEVGDCVSVSRRIDMEMGLSQKAMQAHNQNLRAVLDQQANRARRRVTEAQYMVEGGAFITRSGSLVLTAICTRIE